MDGLHGRAAQGASGPTRGRNGSNLLTQSLSLGLARTPAQRRSIVRLLLVH